MEKSIRSTILSSFIILSLAVLINPNCASAQSIGKNQINIRSGPSLRSRVLFQAPLGYPIKIEKEQGNWVFFRDWVGETGWVYKPFVSNISTAVILVSRANLRSGPGIRYKTVGQAKEGDIYKILEKHGKWCRLGYYYGDKPVGWVDSSLIFGD